MTKKFVILKGSPRKKGNTNALVSIFLKELEKNDIEYKEFDLYDMNLLPCNDCFTCQNVLDSFGCPIKDDMHIIFDSIIESDFIVIASPIYSWSCTPPTKCVLDRLVYGMNKFYGKTRANLWENKKVLIITSCGYRVEKGADLFEEQIKRYCKHSNLNYLGMLCERDLGKNHAFLDENKTNDIKKFAEDILSKQNY